MSEFRKIVIESINEASLEEGKFGKFLGTVATAAALGFGGLSNNAMANTYNPNRQDQVLRTQMNQNVPEWVEHSNKLSADGNDLFFTSEIVRDSNSNNTAQLTRAASLTASSQLVKILTDTVNNNLKGMNTINNNFSISGVVPQKTFWMLLDGEDGKEYHAYSKVKVNKAEIVQKLSQAIKKSNPNIDDNTIQQIVQNSINSLSS